MCSRIAEGDYLFLFAAAISKKETVLKTQRVAKKTQENVREHATAAAAISKKRDSKIIVSVSECAKIHPGGQRRLE